MLYELIIISLAIGYHIYIYIPLIKVDRNIPKHNSERMLTLRKPRTSSSIAPLPPRESIWDSRTIYSEGTKRAGLQLECSSLAMKCERTFHTASNAILDSTIPDIGKGKYMQCFNEEVEAVALELLNKIRQAEYLQKHGLTEGTFTLSKEELEVMCLGEEKKRRKKKEKEMLIELLGEEDGAKLQQKWRKEKKEGKKQNKSREKKNSN